MGSHANATKTAVKGAEKRIVGLDGLRGLMILFVVASHYFGEVTQASRPWKSGGSR